MTFVTISDLSFLWHKRHLVFFLVESSHHLCSVSPRERFLAAQLTHSPLDSRLKPGEVGASTSRQLRKSVNRPPTPDVVDNREKEPTLQELINIKLIESGEKERLMELLRERLIDCGWKDEMKSLCRQFIKKKGRNNFTVDDLVRVITPKGRASIPDSVKAELLQKIRTFLVSTAV
ncbi:hypothetical protein PanWU01x14_146860 [Parasponia andersonii]|uniref:Transcription and mRNA export factor ENY2 n=1 Tax=Parasponia andersonii TaxID=3476 RepID=A0A2P5CJT5_PARAD|nr:hypothetical protein PanWU01x14_146860 [Parasponia andersonii]